MAQGELWATLLTAIDPINASSMPVVLQSTIDLLETELAKARAALQHVQSQPDVSLASAADEVTAGVVEAYKLRLVGLVSGAGTSPYQPLDDQFPARNGNMAAIVPRTSLEDLLCNSLVIEHLAPYLSTGSLFALASTSKTLRSLIMDTPYVFRHLDLTACRGAQVPSMDPIDCGGQSWRSERMDESLTEDEFYSGPLRGIFSDLSRRSVLQDVRTLVLDGLSVPADLISDIILSDRFNISILSIRDCLNLNERKLMQVFQYAVRPTRAKGTPRVKGVYYFSPTSVPIYSANSWYSSTAPSLWNWGDQLPSGEPLSPISSKSTMPGTFDEPSGLSSSVQYQDPTWRHAWYRPSGRMQKNPISNGWAQTLKLCENIISFDAVLCRSPRHDPDNYTIVEENQRPIGSFLAPAVASVALGPRGCEGCRTTPEGPAVWGDSPEAQFPLLAPLPLHSSRITAAKDPVVHTNEKPALIVQCEECVRNRWCRRCDRWWCPQCLPDPERARDARPLVQPTGMYSDEEQNIVHETKHPRMCISRDCWECGPTCTRCMMEVLRTCETCQGEYCIEHNDGCSETKCDWCNTRRRHTSRGVW